MLSFFSRLFDTSDFPARWHCGNWSTSHGLLHILSDLGVWSAYVAIPCVLAYFLLRRKDLPFRRIFLLFGAFILACGTTHLMEAIIFKWPAYRLAGLIKLFTAVISWTTVYALIPIVPRVLAMRSPEELEREIAARITAEEALQRTNAELEQRVEERTRELKQAVSDLKGERELLRTTLASIGDGVIVTDSNGRVTFLNGVAEELTGWSNRAAQSQPLDQVFHIVNEEDRQPIECPATGALRAGTVLGLAHHTILISKDGREFPIENSAAPIRGGADIAGAVLVFRDITERRVTELSLRQLATDLSEADRRKDRFLATLAHELRNPLAPLRNSLQLLKLAGNVQGTVEQVRLIMDRQVTQMVRLVDDLMDVSRITRDKLQLRKERIDLAAVVSSAVETSRPLIQEMGHELTVQLPPEPIVLDADLTRLAQVFMNLLNNAAKYSEPGGHIWLTAVRQANEVVVTVKDSGIGIAADQLSHIFEMFIQVDQSLEKSRGGLGIGLTLVKGLVEMHGGTVEARSAGLGSGSEVVVRLPVAMPANAEQHAADAVIPGGTGPSLRILVVDDNRDAASSLMNMLQAMGHDTRSANDGLEALEVAATFKPQVVLLDIGMPRLNGYDTARRIRQEAWGKEVLLVAQTGWGQEEDKRQAQAAGFNFHLVKPVDPVALQQILAGV